MTYKSVVETFLRILREFSEKQKKKPLKVYDKSLFFYNDSPLTEGFHKSVSRADG